MTTIKSYTDLEQSKKLAEILPLESADMYYHYNTSVVKNYHEDIPNVIQLNNHFAFFNDDIPCWSLAALLGVLPKIFNYNNHTYQFMYNTHAMYYINVDNYDEDTFCSINKNLVDACVEMILKLNELNLL